MVGVKNSHRSPFPVPLLTLATKLPGVSRGLLKRSLAFLPTAKLRFQEQIQQIRQLSKRPLEKSQRELRVPRLSSSPGDDMPNAPCREILEASSQDDETPSSSRHAGTVPGLHWG